MFVERSAGVRSRPAASSGLRLRVLAFGIALVLPLSAFGQAFSEPVLLVEEDWLLVLNEPDDSVDSPQFHTVMSPTSSIDHFYAQVVWNYREYPDFMPGGLELQGWQGDDLLRTKTPSTAPLSTYAETIVWSQALEIINGSLYFYIYDGQSTTWGSFGNGMRLVQGGSYEDLNAYDPAVSVANACITYGSNRVDKLMITEVRWIGLTDVIKVDSTPRIVYEAPQE